MKQVGPHSTRSQNHNVNGGPTMGGKHKGQMDGGADLSRDATNVITVCGTKMKEYSPSATKQSKNA